MANIARLDIRVEQQQPWVDRLIYYRKLLRAHSVGFEPASIATSMLDNILRTLPPQNGGDGNTVDITIPGSTAQSLASNKFNQIGNQDADRLVSPSAEMGTSIGIFSNDLLSLDAIDFEMEWLSGSGIGWNADSFI